MDAVNAIATVTAIFKKDPWCLIAHPNSAITIFADLIFYSVKLKFFLTIYKGLTKNKLSQIICTLIGAQGLAPLRSLL